MFTEAQRKKEQSSIFLNYCYYYSSEVYAVNWQLGTAISTCMLTVSTTVLTPEQTLWKLSWKYNGMWRKSFLYLKCNLRARKQNMFIPSAWLWSRGCIIWSSWQLLCANFGGKLQNGKGFCAKHHSGAACTSCQLNCRAVCASLRTRVCVCKHVRACVFLICNERNKQHVYFQAQSFVYNL